MDHISVIQHWTMKHYRLSLLLTIFTFSLLKEGHAICSRNWLSYGTQCIKIVPKEKYALPLQDAYINCYMQGGTLASISSVETLAFVTMHLNSFGYGNLKFWVGLSETNGSLYWLDGVPAEDQPWVIIPQTNASAASLNITSILLRAFLFNGEIVEAAQNISATYGYICAKNKTLFDPVEDCLGNRSKHSFIGEVSGNCIYRSPDATNRDNVDRKCAETGGRFLDLDEIANEGVAAIRAHHVLTDDGYKYWTAMTFNDSKVYWKDGLEFTAFTPTRGNGSCVSASFKVMFPEPVQLFQTECEDHAHVICAAPRALPTTQASSPQAIERHGRCPIGQNWKTFITTNACYWETSFETSRLSWDDARAFCQGYGGDLASFHSIEEEKIGLSFQYGSLAHPYWIGLRLDPETETYKWSDGMPLDYSNWAPGHPNHRDKRLGCVAMNAISKNWISSLCGIISWFICKVPKRTSPPAPRIPPRKPLPECDSSGSFYFEGYCYEVVNVQAHWHRARESCESKGSSLVSIHSDKEIGFLLRLLYDDKTTRGNRVWIGLSSLSGVFRWTDWTPVDLTYWNVDEPNNYMNTEKCVNMYIGNGLWNDENCSNNMGYICKQLKNATVIPQTITTIDPLIGNCKSGWYAYHDKCYLPVGFAAKDRVNWTTAKDICHEMGGSLVSIRGEIEQNYLTYLMQGLKDDTWIGLHDTIQSGRYYWIDSSELRYTNWAIGEPSFFGIQEDCVKMVYHDVDSGVWEDDVCSRKLPFICQTNKDPDLPEPLFNRGLSCIYPEGWLKLNDMCFKMFVGNPISWSEAEDECKRNGAHLVSVSEISTQAVAVYLGTEVNQSFWIGLQYQASRQRFEWLNDWIMTISKWGKNEPVIPSDGNSCYSSTYDGYWRRSACNEQKPYICQITNGKGPYLTKYGGECPNPSDEWIPTAGSYCHHVGKSKADWFSSTLRCFRYGSFLLSLHSLNDIEMVKKSMSGSFHGIQSLFIGLLKNRKGGFSWSDHSPVDFVNWDAGQPDNDDDSCVEMVTNTFKWRVVPCYSVKHYICSHMKDQVIENTPENAKFGDGTSGGLSVAALTATVVCVTLAVVIIVAGLLFFRPSLGKTRFRIPFKQHSMNFENALYNADSASMEFQDERRDSFDR